MEWRDSNGHVDCGRKCTECNGMDDEQWIEMEWFVSNGNGNWNGTERAMELVQKEWISWSDTAAELVGLLCLSIFLYLRYKKFEVNEFDIAYRECFYYRYLGAMFCSLA